MSPTVLIFATSYFPLVGGAQFAILEITRRQPETLFHLYCARLSWRTSFRERQGNVCIHRIGLGLGIDRFLFPLIAPVCALRYRKEVKTIWAMMAQYGGFAALLYHFLTGRSKRLVLTLQEGGDFAEMEQKAGLLLPLMRAVARNATTLQTISSALLEWGKSLGYAGSDFHVLPNGVDSALFGKVPAEEDLSALRARHTIGANTIVLFSASRLAGKNGMLDLVDSMAQLPAQYVLLIAGEGYLRSAIESRIAQHGLQGRVTLLGSLALEQVAVYLHISKVFVRPSLSEGLGNAFLEAMAAGVPVVGTMVGGIKDFLVDGQTGVVAQPGESASIAAAIQRYENEELYSRVQRAGKEMVICQFNWDTITGKMKVLLEG